MSSARGTVTIRAASNQDVATIIGIYNWAINQTFATIDSEPLSEEEAATWWQDHARNSVILVAEEEGDVVGFARLMPWKQRGYDVVEDLVYVDPVHQSRGVGRALLERALEAGRQSGVRSMVASIAADNSSALKLHASLGFEVVGTLRDAAYKFDRWMDITLVQHSLGN